MTNQVAMELPHLPPGACCDHAPPAAPVLGQGHGPVPTSVDIRTVYLSTKVMAEFMAYAKVRARHVLQSSGRTCKCDVAVLQLRAAPTLEALVDLHSFSSVCMFDLQLGSMHPSHPPRAMQYNTQRNIETCGILCGELNAKEDNFTITALVIPKQKGEPNNVEMHGEEDLAEYCMTRDLITLGWIHSHPTQTCFLSSIDVHTHFPYQARSCVAKLSILTSSRATLSRKSLQVEAVCAHARALAASTGRTAPRALHRTRVALLSKLQLCTHVRPRCAGVSSRGYSDRDGANGPPHQVWRIPAHHTWRHGRHPRVQAAQLPRAQAAVDRARDLRALWSRVSG